MNYTVWILQWRQAYTAWPQPKQQPQLEPEITDFTQAREVLARIMSL